MLEAYLNFIRRVLPSPFSIAVALTGLTFILVGAYQLSYGEFQPGEIVKWWQTGMWDTSLMKFSVQMMLMLVLGHALSLTPAADKLIEKLTGLCNSNAQAVWVVCSSAMLMSLFNWGLGLIFGAILARKVAESFAERGKPMNYPLMAAAGYGGLMVWHGGLSGSALIKAAEPNGVSSLYAGLSAPVPNVPLSLTLFSAENLITTGVVVVMVPAVLYLVARKFPLSLLDLSRAVNEEEPNHPKPIGAEKMDHSRTVALLTGSAILGLALWIYAGVHNLKTSFFTPDNINLTLLGLAILLHKNFTGFMRAIRHAIPGASGILIQFPLYFGIMGLIANSGLIERFSELVVTYSSENTLGLFTMVSAGIVNLFVPSGGGQWVVQGPIVIKACELLRVPFEKGILALAYGDQLTNMIQPFWALPLLGITGLSARDILPYTLIMFGAGAIVFGIGVFIF
ncbi:MAG: short-chain fatty acid transporter [Salibacteraceae bacterium]